MKAYRFHTGLRLEPFGDPVSAAQLGCQELGMAVAQALLAAGFQPDLPPAGAFPEREFAVLPDWLFATRAALRLFRAACPAGDGVYRLGLRRSALTDYLWPLQRVEEDAGALLFDLFLVRGERVPPVDGWEALRAWLAPRARPVVIDPPVAVEPWVQSRPGPPRQSLALPRCDALVAEVRHWVHLLWLNHLLPWVRLQEHWQDRPWQRRLRLGQPDHPARQAARLSVIGRGSDIHPTAWVEGSILGRGVRLGPFVSVRDCILGDGVEIGEHTRMLRCTVGAECHTLNDSYFIGCTFYPGSTLANLMIRHSVIGRRVFLTSAVMFWDEAIEAPVRVLDGAREVETGRWCLGGCAGHGCVLGTRAIFLPGRAVPNHTMIVLRPDEGVTKVPLRAEPNTPYVSHQGSIVPLAQALPDWSPPEIGGAE